ncbi:MAG: hypothetical protein Q9195_003122 [Heterodermia aff. obscurata]
MPSPSPTTRASLLRSTAESFVKAFVAGTSPTSILNTYFTSSAQIYEHGPAWANARLPFLGKTFTGRRQSGSDGGSTCDDYYDLLTRTLSFHPTEGTVPASAEFVVDAEALGPGGGRGVVTVKMRAGFKSIKSGGGWEEEFVYVLSGFDDEGRIGRQELWADPLSAWVAVGE